MSSQQFELNHIIPPNGLQRQRIKSVSRCEGRGDGGVWRGTRRRDRGICGGSGANVVQGTKIPEGTYFLRRNCFVVEARGYYLLSAFVYRVFVVVVVEVVISVTRAGNTTAPFLWTFVLPVKTRDIQEKLHCPYTVQATWVHS
jgi:hypothetical protein